MEETIPDDSADATPRARFALTELVAGVFIGIALVAVALPIIGSLAPKEQVSSSSGSTETRVDLSGLHPDEFALVPHRGGLYYVIRRSPEMIRAATSLRDAGATTDATDRAPRTKDPEWLVLDARSRLGVPVTYVPSQSFSGRDTEVGGGYGITRDAILFENRAHGGLWDLDGRLLWPNPTNVSASGWKDLRVPKYHFEGEHTLVLFDGV